MAFAATAVGFTVFAKVLSPQFLVWLLAAVVLIAGIIWLVLRRRATVSP